MSNYIEWMCIVLPLLHSVYSLSSPLEINIKAKKGNTFAHSFLDENHRLKLEIYICRIRKY